MRATAIVVLAMAALAAMAASAPDARRGQEAFEKRCTGCHSLDRVKVGPPLRNVYGHQAGKNSQFSYSDAVKSAAVIWDETTLDQWLVDTESVIPDNDMTFRLGDAAERADIIAYLKQLSGK